MTRTEQVLLAARVDYDDYDNTSLDKLSDAFERFLLALDAETFQALLESLKAQQGCQG